MFRGIVLRSCTCIHLLCCESLDSDSLGSTSLCAAKLSRSTWPVGLRNLIGPLCPMRFLIRQRYVDTQQHDRSLITPNHQIPTRGREVSQLSQHQHVNKFAHAPRRLLCSSSKLGICLCFITFGRTLLGEEVSPG